MDSSEMIRAISLLRHDFLNHLQVISGYLQLEKLDRTLEYISKITKNLQKLSKVVHLEVPEVAVAFLFGEEMARGVEANITYNLEFDLLGCAVPGPVIGQSVNVCLRHVFYRISIGKDPQLKVEIKRMDDGFGAISLNFNISEGNLLSEDLDKVNEKLKKYGGHLKRSENISSKTGYLELFFPLSGET